jgi:hypothetical protein
VSGGPQAEAPLKKMVYRSCLAGGGDAIRSTEIAKLDCTIV